MKKKYDNDGDNKIRGKNMLKDKKKKQYSTLYMISSCLFYCV